MRTLAAWFKVGGSFVTLLGIFGGIFGSFGYSVRIGGAIFPRMDWMSALFIIVFGCAFFLIGHFLEKRLPKEKVEIPKLDINDLAFITKALKKTRNRIMGFSIFLLLFTIIIIFAQSALEDGSSSVGTLITINVILALCAGLSGAMFVSAYKNWNIPESKAYKIIMLEPQTITHLKVLMTQSGLARGSKVGKFFNANVYIGKKSIAYFSTSESDILLLKQYLEKANPQLIYERKEIST
jgi:MFS family permease